MRRIRIIRTSVTEYVPDLNESAYLDHNVQTLEEALALDLGDLKAGKIYSEELSYDLPEVTFKGEIIDD